MLLSKAKFFLRLVYFLLSRQIHNFVLNFKRKKFWILETDFVSRLEIIWQETKHSNATVSAVFNRENKIVARYLFLQLIRTLQSSHLSMVIRILLNFLFDIFSSKFSLQNSRVSQRLMNLSGLLYYCSVKFSNLLVTVFWCEFST